MQRATCPRLSRVSSTLWSSALRGPGGNRSIMAPPNVATARRPYTGAPPASAKSLRRVELDVGGRGERHLLGLIPLRMADDEVAVGQERRLPVAPRRARAEQGVLDDVRAVGIVERWEPRDPRDPALAVGALEDDPDVVVAVGQERRLPVAPRRARAEQ